MKAIITFHSIDATNSVLSFHPKKFFHLIKSLIQSGIPILPLDELLDKNCSNGITLTFDDGMESVYTDALPVLKKFSVQSHLFLTTSVVGRENNWLTQSHNSPRFKMMNWDQIFECASAGVSIDAHTHTHPKLNALTIQEIQDECLLCDEIIEKKMGRKPKYFAYPYGLRDERVRRFISTRYTASATTFLGFLNENDESLLPRLDSYYLQSNWLHSRINKPLGITYLKNRSLIRSIRRHQ